ncbi:MAG: glycosyltransferase family 39 protein [Myxococcales bacterium]|nr:glycosyltransferase family 39 protein [Myxococcales bacterium]HIK85146.1 glycosyltransferase family 39 protein [Myxococcales bacterium]
MAAVKKSNDRQARQGWPVAGVGGPQASEPSGAGRVASRSSRRAFLILLLATALLYGTGLGGRDFWAPDEPRYGAIAEEIRSFRHGASGLVLLHLNGAPYTQKPPLYFWLAAAFGVPSDRVHEIAARLPSALAGVFCVGLTAWIGQLVFRPRLPTILAAGVLATSFRFVFTARRAQLDVLLTGFELAAIAIFLFLEFRRGGIENARRNPLAIAGLHACLGAAALTKGPVGWLPLLVFAAYLGWEGRLRGMRAILPVWSHGLSLAPILVWFLAANSLAPPGFAEVAVGENLIGRFFSGTSHARPFYYFILQLPLNFMPWTLLLPFAVTKLWRSSRTPETQVLPISSPPAQRTDFLVQRPVARFLIVWIVVPFVFFSLSAGKRGVYLLPIFPALAIVSVMALERASASGSFSTTSLRRLGQILVLVAGIEFALVTIALPLLNNEKSPRPIAEAAARRSKPGESIGVFGLRALEGGIAYYGERTVVSLRDESALRDFLDRGGRFVILRDRQLGALAAEFDLHAAERFRGGRRRLALAERANSKRPGRAP